jgi:hypothetical protein
MATIQFYNQAARLIFANGIAALGLKLELLNNTATFDATHTTKAQVDNTGAYEVSGNGWTAGGVALSNVTVATTTTNDVKVTADAINITASGGSMPSAAAYKANLYADSLASDPPIAFITFDSPLQAGDGTNLLINIPTTGLITGTVA